MRLLILADDLTGALDTGVQFAKCGAETKIFVDPEAAFTQANLTADVIAIDTETRHLDAGEAYRIVVSVVRRAKEANVEIVYKKVDSALRGNVGSELDAILTATGRKLLLFAPAFPKLNRFTVGGVQYVGNVPVHESVFGNDPFDPVTESFIPSIIKKSSSLPVCLYPAGVCPKDCEGIAVQDATSDQDLRSVIRAAGLRSQAPLLAGCAGLAEQLAGAMFRGKAAKAGAVWSRKILIVSGSLNPITLRQLRIAKLMQIPYVTMHVPESGVADTEADALAQNVLRMLHVSATAILETNDSDFPFRMEGKQDTVDAFSGRIVAESMGRVVFRLIEMGFDGTIVAVGGDTLKGIVSHFASFEFDIQEEIEPGVVFSAVRLGNNRLTMASKSGGIGSDRIFLSVINYVNRCRLTSERLEPNAANVQKDE